MSQSCVYPLLALGIMCAIFTGSVYGDCQSDIATCQTMGTSSAAQAGDLEEYCKAINKVIDCYKDMASTCLGGLDAVIDNFKSIANSKCTENMNGGKNRVESSVLVLVVAVLILPALGLLGQ